MVCHALPSRPPQHGLGLELSGSKIVDARRSPPQHLHCTEISCRVQDARTLKELLPCSSQHAVCHGA